MINKDASQNLEVFCPQKTTKNPGTFAALRKVNVNRQFR
jgi:hypothetical protein